MQPILQMKNISKTFPGVKALNEVDFSVNSGVVHALIGENGAGKSTLMKVLTGIFTADSGEIWYKGEQIFPKNPKEMSECGISIIHQEFNLIPDLTVAENIYITKEPRRLGNLVINDKKLIMETKALLKRLGLDIKADRFVDELSVAEKQMVEIAKALVTKSDILVLDEPTSALAENEVQKLFEIIRDLRGQGVAVIYISHRLEEFEQIVDEVTVLRDGCYVSHRVWAETSIKQVIKDMVGRSLDEQYPARKHKIGEVIFEAKNISRGTKVKDVSLNVRRGEIIGLAGLMGAGRSEFARAVFGADYRQNGEVLVNGKPIMAKTPSDAIKSGIAYLPEDRKVDGLFLDQEVDMNVLSASLNDCAKFGVINDKNSKIRVEEIVKNLNIKTPSIKQIVGFLSGGNQQKVLISRWILKDADIFIFDEPTRGIDVGAKYEVYSLLNRLAEGGAGVIMISSEMTEILGMSDRIYILSEGKLMGELNQQEATQERILHLASGIYE